MLRRMMPSERRAGDGGAVHGFIVRNLGASEESGVKDFVHEYGLLGPLDHTGALLP